MIFQLFLPNKSIEMQIWLCHKKVNSQPMIIIWTNLVERKSSMLYTYTKIQSQTFFGSEEEDFQDFYHVQTWRPSCSVAQNHLNKLAIPYRQKAHVKSS